jgi:hypothetical protein
MRRCAISIVAVLAALALFAAPAQATFHLNMVNEVMLASASGNNNEQFVEFLDLGGTEEQFTPLFAPYKLVVYDGAGNELGQQTLNPSGLRAAAAGRKEYLVSTPAVDVAFGVTGNELLTVSLPRTAGQVCFAGSEPPPQPVSCMTYGTITKKIATNSSGTGVVHGPVPPNGESDQRQSDRSVIAALPTPKAPNGSAQPPGQASPPSVSHASLTGIGPRRARLHFLADAGVGAPKIAKIMVQLPKGLSFDSSRFARGLHVAGPGGGRLQFSDHLRGRRLTIALPSPAASASVTANHGAIGVSRALAARVRHHHLKKLTTVVTVIDTNGTSTRFTFTTNVR